jgi:hypothetical protein
MDLIFQTKIRSLFVNTKNQLKLDMVAILQNITRNQKVQKSVKESY